MKKDIRKADYRELRDLVCNKLDKQEFHLDDLYKYLYKDGICDFRDMAYLPDILIDELDRNYYISRPGIIKKTHSEIDETTKYAICYDDGVEVESVFLPQRDWNSICLSTQVGCKRGCRFCATGLMGFKRNLYWGEIVDQVRLVMEASGEIRNIVFMGMGEPFDNYDEVLKAMKYFLDEYDFGKKRITLSTAGVIEGMERFIEEDVGIRIALSLNAVTSDMRKELMPGLDDDIKSLIELLHVYARRNNDMATIEYILINGVNDGVENANKLLKLLNRYRFKINIIPYNEILDLPFARPSEIEIDRFVNVLRKSYNAPVMVRDSKGLDIDGACGQLIR